MQNLYQDYYIYSLKYFSIYHDIDTNEKENDIENEIENIIESNDMIIM